MTGTGEFAEFLPAYLAEADELLASAQKDLLAVEEAVRKGQAQPRAVRELFRALHTLKGLSAMVDVEPVVSLAHWMEASLRLADQAGGRLPESSVEPLVEGLRAIELRVRQLGAGKTASPAPANLLERLEALGPQVRDAVPKRARPVKLDAEASFASRLAPSEREQLEGGLAGGQRALRLDFVPSSERAAKGLNINTVRERVAKLADIVKVLPLSGAAAGGASLAFALLLITRAEDGVLLDTVGGPPATVRSLEAPAPAEAPPEDGDGVPEGVEGLPGAAVLEEELEEPEVRRGGGLLRVEVSRLDEAMEWLASLVVNRSRLMRAVAALTQAGAPTREITAILQENGRQLRDLRSAILRLRMVRVGDVLERLPLLVRGLRRATGKAVRLELDVGDAELDKAVADRLLPALVHLVRNAVDHALESPEERQAASKPAEGLVRLTCHASANGQLELTLRDDGRGVDAKAVAKAANAPVPDSADALLDLLCRPGLSTRQEATRTSGRGMGMDIVRRIVVEQLGGELRMDTRKGVGTTFTVCVPLTVTLMDAIVFECAGRRYAVSVGTVEELIDVTGVVRPAGADGLGLVERRGAAVPLVSLARLLDMPVSASEAGQGAKALIVRQRGEPVAFAVDRLVGQQEIVLRPLEDPLVRVPGVAGATDLGDGQPTLVLDLGALGAARVGRRKRASRAGEWVS
ncbi:putative chemotaxis protein CheA [Corallococcus coralloides DSM 2259]|uniref:histidine kinase n=1 Tax=Corallococcus coralloides (strain ATCC 25202 / DSM 2259 / NBRC 100086 / M2) TaxID=1144275 RepID=H8MQA5_CORCM|nr:chemotaxis protein CheW [Corallococcus coralloides]AFE08306.1 putative chemotaxis protein CheA [Corallococcus coralloides DSM 2259]